MKFTKTEQQLIESYNCIGIYGGNNAARGKRQTAAAESLEKKGVAKITFRHNRGNSVNYIILAAK